MSISISAPVVEPWQSGSARVRSVAHYAPQDALKAARQRTALIVEPELRKRLALRRLLRENGFERVLETSAAREAILQLGEELVDLVLTPWETADLSGAALLQALSDRGQNRDVPIVLLDDGLAPQSVVAAVKAGVAGRLPVPTDAEHLREVLREVEERAKGA